MAAATPKLRHLCHTCEVVPHLSPCANDAGQNRWASTIPNQARDDFWRRGKSRGLPRTRLPISIWLFSAAQDAGVGAHEEPALPFTRAKSLFRARTPASLGPGRTWTGKRGNFGWSTHRYVLWVSISRGFVGHPACQWEDGKLGTGGVDLFADECDECSVGRH